MIRCSLRCQSVTDQPLTPEALAAAAADYSRRDVHRRVSRNHTDSAKGFSVDIPRLVLWFPNHLGPPREGGPSLYGEELDDTDTYRAGERSGGGGYESPGAPRRTPPSPWDSPPFPTLGISRLSPDWSSHESDRRPIQKALLLGPYGDAVKDNRIEIHGWATVGGNWSNANKSNLPTAYWIVPNTIPTGPSSSSNSSGRSTGCRPTIWTGGSNSQACMVSITATRRPAESSVSNCYIITIYMGSIPVEFWVELYVPNILEGFVVRLGRWIACPDIEAQYAPDNYLAISLAACSLTTRTPRPAPCSAFRSTSET